MPLASSTADAHGASWCEPMITVSSLRPGSRPTTLWQRTRLCLPSTFSRPRCRPSPSNRRKQIPSARLSYSPDSGRGLAT